MKLKVNHFHMLSSMKFKDLMNFIRRLLFDQTLTLLIPAFVHSRSEYGDAAFVGHSASDIHGLHSVQNATVCLVTGAKRYDHVTPLLES
jgi:hypothetical protein